MNKKRGSSLWAGFVLSAFAAVILSFFAVSWFVIVAKRMGVVDYRLRYTYGKIVISLLSGIIIGTVMGYY